MARRLRRQATGWEKIFAKHLSDRGLVSVSKIHQTFKQTKPLKTQQENNPTSKWTKNLKIHLTKEDTVIFSIHKALDPGLQQVPTPVDAQVPHVKWYGMYIQPMHIFPYSLH